MIREIGQYTKREIVTTVSFILAVVSMAFVHPDKEYLSYVHWSTISTLMCLMLVMSGLKAVGIFEYTGKAILGKAHNARAVVMVLVGLCYCLAPLITNDVALITFVPFAIFVLEYSNLEQYIIPTLALQTIAAHMGSMLTPTGNPHNIYLFGLLQLHEKWGVGRFMLKMLPFFLIAGVLLLVFVLVITRRNEGITERKSVEQDFTSEDRRKIILYALLFAISLIPVFGFIQWYYILPIVIVCIIIFDRANLFKPDYSLLFTFIFLFIFIGNLGRIEVISNTLTGVVKGNELIVSVLASQVISNAPASILLSGFSDKYFVLALGTDIGGLGTLIASMANLISFKHYSSIDGARSGKYILHFSIINVLFIIPMMIAAFLILGR